MQRSGIRVMLEAAWDLEAEGHEVLHLGVGQPDFPAPAVAILAAKQALDDGMTNYIPNAGLPGLRQAIATMYSQTAPNRKHSVANILVTHGSMFSFSSAFMTVLNPGDEVLLPDPGFPNYNMAVELLHAKPVPYPLLPQNDWLPRVEDMEAKLTDKTKLLLLNSPSNPTGAVLQLPVLKRLLDFAKFHGLFVLSDEIYSDIVFHNNIPRAPSVLQVEGHDEESTMVVSGVAKNYSMTGFRVGWLHAHESLVTVATKLQEPFISCGVPFSQVAAQAVIEGPVQEYVAEMASAYKRRRDLAVSILKEHGLFEYSPEGAFYILVDCGQDSMVFCKKLLADRHVAVAPGSAFGLQSTNYVRISLASSDSVISRGVTALCEAIKQPS